VVVGNCQLHLHCQGVTNRRLHAKQPFDAAHQQRQQHWGPADTIHNM
jgi:hypothetical protein